VEVALEIVGIVIVVGVVAGTAERLNLSPPLVLVIVGVIVSFIPGVPRVEIDPDLVLFGLLPPLLYSAAIRTSLVDFKANRNAIILLSVGAVAFTTVTVGLVAWWVAPITLAAAFALGAVVAPPDAVAASAIARRVGMPRRIVSILEGESLVNDATALVALNVAIASLTRRVTVFEVGWRFLLAAGGGVAVGLLAGILLAKVRKHIRDPVLDTTLSFVAPWVAFIPAEAINASGVLAVVVTGLLLGHKSPIVQTAASRIAENTNWRSIAFLLENAVFLLIGLELRTVIEGIADTNLSGLEIIWTCVAVLLATIAARAIWIYAVALVYRNGPQELRKSAWGWDAATVVSWAGMRGVVTLAAAFLLPASTPQLQLLQLAAFTVVAGTLLLQGSTLPWLIRRMGLIGPDPAEDALQAASLVNAAAQAGLQRLSRVKSPDDPPEIIAELNEKSARRSNALWERLGRSQEELETPQATYRRLRLEMLDAERTSVLEARDRGGYDDEVLRTALTAIDIEESILDRIDDAESRLDDDLRSPPRPSGDCSHLKAAPRVATARTPGACEECLRDGTRWVHLRLCLACGHVGCCDSSVGRHATGHFRDTTHPVMRSIEPGEAWRWCYVDEQLG
jgi:CPA1 family monovalent cation:H+ antiporter